LDSFPCEIDKPGTTTVFIGQPVDYVHFDPEEGVTFIEVKSGNAKLSRVQRMIKARIQAGDVKWREVYVRAKKVGGE